MKIIDQTPLIDEKGNIGFSQRIQGMLKFGFNWPTELLAQKAIITYFDRNLENGYTLIRNQTLGQSGIMIPLILIGPAGMFAINIAYLKGRYEAKGDAWNVESGNRFKPAPVNLIQSTARMGRALTMFIERQGTRLPEPVESVLIAADPGLHVESDKPAIRVLMVDGIKPFVIGLSNSMPILRSDLALDMVERITNPRPPKQKTNLPQPAPAMPRQEPAQTALGQTSAAAGKYFARARYLQRGGRRETHQPRRFRLCPGGGCGGCAKADSLPKSRQASALLRGMNVPPYERRSLQS